LTVLLPSEHEAATAAETTPSSLPNLKFAAHKMHPSGRRTRTPASHLYKLGWEQVTVPRAARRLGGDLLHVPYWASPIVTPIPTVVTIHDIIPHILPAYRGGIRVRLYTALVSAAALRARRVLTDSEAARGDILRHLHIPAHRVHAVPLAADAAYGDAAAADDAAQRGSLHVPKSYILYLGGFDVRKNVRAMFEAFSIVQRARPEAHLVVGGRLPRRDTDFAPDPRRLAREAGLDEDHVHFLGFVAEDAKPALYRGARLFVWPTTYEGFGLPPLEALSCGAPVVGSDTTSLPEIVGDAGVLVHPQDVAGMAGAMLQLWIDDVFHRTLRQRALRHAQHFSWERTARATLAVYKEAAASRPPPGSP
jgi:glycosyltransferase involved in cell wall biosynthesis